MSEERKDLQEITVEPGIEAGIQDVEISKEVRSSFLDYAMSVIVSRAIPDVRDGLKPVHRRIIYGMHEAGMQPDKPYKKSARIVGDVMGKYHPHGDQAIYSTLVRLAQPFAMREILVDGHGNFGSVDGDEAAAMRYTEARMTPLAVEMVRGINENTIDFTSNYDGTEKEPVVLPARFPNLLVNGSSGIAVGMATNIPTHNLGEVIDAINLIARDPEVTPREIMMKALPGPDFPTGGTILGKAGIVSAYEEGRGTIVIRSKAHFEDMSGGKSRIIVTEIPYQVNKATQIEKIVDLVRNKVIDGITDIRDESNHEGIRVVIELRRDVIADVVWNNILKQTQLQTSFGIINLCIVDGAPRVLNIKEMLENYLDFQVEVIKRRTTFLLEGALARDHIVVGLLKAIDNIDEIIEISKTSANRDEAAQIMMERFDFSEIQAREVLSLTIGRLTGLEVDRLVKERDTLEENIAKYRLILSSRENMVEEVLKELNEIKERYATPRLTELSDDLADIDNEDLIPEEEIIISLTKNGYIKRTSPDEFRTQNRGGKGVRGMKTYEDDVVDILVHTKTHTDILFFTSFGKVYRLRGYQIPLQQRTGRGMPIVNLLNLDKDEKVRSILSIDEYDDKHYLFYVTKLGTVKRTRLDQFELIRQTGKIAITLKDGDELVDVKKTTGDLLIGIGASNGKMVKFKESDVRSMGRTAAGVKGITLEEGEYVVGVTTSSEGNYVLSLSSRGFGKMTKADEYRLTKRGAKGVITMNVGGKNGELVGLVAVSGEEDLMIITEEGTIIRLSLTQVARSGRNTKGVRVIRLKDKEAIASFAVVEHFDDEEDEEELELKKEKEKEEANENAEE
ncbi:MAG TPA: DNA gyrase subunit A [Bacilli bacterium]|nr:DNA gyrase subunit A [Bacilli bacterium]HPK86287.1 DNA gyrase subunit A [Bacilli bacterium]